MEDDKAFNELKEALKADIIDTIDTCPDVNILIGLATLLLTCIDQFKADILKHLNIKNN